jgi:hypothetical protein
MLRVTFDRFTAPPPFIAYHMLVHLVC